MTQLTSIDDLLEQMVALGASDLHVTVGSPPAYRVRGHIVRAEGFENFAADDTRALLYRILSSEQQKHFELNRQLDFAYSMPGVARFRVNVYYQREAVGAAFRLSEISFFHIESLIVSSPRRAIRADAAAGRAGDGPRRRRDRRRRRSLNARAGRSAGRRGSSARAPR